MDTKEGIKLTNDNIFNNAICNNIEQGQYR